MRTPRLLVGNFKPRFIPIDKVKVVERRLLAEQLRQLESRWSSTKVPIPKGFRVEGPNEQIARIVARQIRFGKRIRLRHGVKENGHGTKSNQVILFETKKRIVELHEQGGKREKWILAHISRIRIHRACHYLIQALDGQKPNPLQVLAFLGLRHGLNSPPLRDSARALTTLWDKHKESCHFEGNPSGYTKAILFEITRKGCQKTNLISAIEAFLFDNKNRGFTFQEIAQGKGIGIEWDENVCNQIILRSAIHLLDVCGLIMRLPSVAIENGTMPVWCHASNVPPIDWQNPDLDILIRLSFGRRKKVDLMKSSTISTTGQQLGNRNAIFGANTIDRSVKYLEAIELVETSKETATQGRPPIIVQLTAKGERLMRIYYKTKTLPEGLRRLLVGNTSS